jgi:hypothetical protein
MRHKNRKPVLGISPGTMPRRREPGDYVIIRALHPLVAHSVDSLPVLVITGTGAGGWNRPAPHLAGATALMGAGRGL